MGLEVAVLVNSPRGEGLIRCPAELLHRSAHTSRVKLPNGDVIKVKNSRVVAPTPGPESLRLDQAQDSFFIGQKVALSDGKRRAVARVVRVTDDGVTVSVKGHEIDLTPEMLG